MNIHILDEAKQDLIDGYHFYQSQELDLGEYFYDSLFADIDSLILKCLYNQPYNALATRNVLQ